MADLVLGEDIAVIDVTPRVTTIVVPEAQLVESPLSDIVIETPAPDLVDASQPDPPNTFVITVAGGASEGGGLRYTGLDPVELPNGARTQFTSPVTYITGTLSVYLNGLQEHFVVQDSSTTFHFSTAPMPGDVIKLELTPA